MTAKEKSNAAIAAFCVNQQQPYEFKKAYAEKRAREFYEDERVDGNCCCSVGGLDSITLAVFLHSIGLKDVRLCSVSSLEDKSIQRVHKALGVEVIHPYKSKIEVLRDCGFPVISKAKAKKISLLQQPNAEKQTFIHAIMTGDMGAQGHFQHSDKIKLPDKWIQLFGGNYYQHRPDLLCVTADFPVGADCCLWMKEKPMNDWQKEHGLYPYLGLMASEGGQRELGLKKNGCNYFGKTTTRSCPFAIFQRDDVLQLALEMDAYYQKHWQEFNPDPEVKVDSIIPEIYGTIEYTGQSENKNGVYKHYRTTKAQRTGCTMCGFGIHMEGRPHRFDRIYERNPQEWEFWMYGCAKDANGNKYDWGRVLDHIGVPWRNPEAALDQGEQVSLF